MPEAIQTRLSRSATRGAIQKHNVSAASIDSDSDTISSVPALRTTGIW